LPYAARAQPSFVEGAVIRTILRDYAPGELGGGATLFHEHMSFAPRLSRAIPAVRGRGAGHKPTTECPRASRTDRRA
jgi:hypothetical protein